jgi:two-component system, LytTR family, response regulator
MSKALIVDDELHARQLLEKLLARHCPEITLVLAAQSGAEAIELLDQHEVTLVFLDMQMPGMSGLELLNTLKTKPFDVIFTTAHHEYAIEAIRQSALDYLLKPIDADELKAAVRKHLQRRHTVHDLVDLYSDLLTRLASATEQTTETRLLVNTHDGLFYLNPEEILYLKGDRNYTWVYLQDGKKIMSAKTLKDYETQLPDYFFRIHKSHLVNLHHFSKILPFDRLELLNGSVLEVSRRRRTELLQKLSLGTAG